MQANDPEKAVTFGDGTPLLAHVIHDCLKILEEESAVIPWQKGDDLLLDNLDYPEFIDRLEEHGLIYTRVLGEGDDSLSPIGRGWVSTFMTKYKVMNYLKAGKLGMTPERTDDGVKTVMGPIPAIKFDETSQRKIWFNSMVATYTG
nr:clavaminate synthase-like protein At3g21360 [Tanacetum cinerariifolium]